MNDDVRTIVVEPGSELDRLLDDIDDNPVELVRGGARFRIMQVDDGNEDIWAGYDPERAAEGIREAAGAWEDLDAEAMIEMIYRAREEGSRPADRP